MIDLLIIGGGVSGVTAAITRKRKDNNSNILILERNNELLKKLSITGNGKGNLTNTNLNSSYYNNPLFIDEALDNRDYYNLVKDYYESLNIKMVSDNEGRCYPYSLDAKTISYLMVKELKRLDINYKLKEDVLKIDYSNNIFTITSVTNTYEAKELLISTGSKNYPSLGSNLSLKKEIEKLGHTFTKLLPSNTYINVFSDEMLKRFKGSRFKVTMTLYNDNKEYYKESGELLLKESSLSGIVSFNLSNKLQGLYKNDLDKNPYILVDFIDGVNSKELNENDLYSYLKKDFVDYIISKNLKNSLNSYKFIPYINEDFKEAQETVGGINLNEINPKTMESKLIKGLYFSGDILDIDSISGGFNLSNAILSGLNVGNN